MKYFNSFKKAFIFFIIIKLRPQIINNLFLIHFKNFLIYLLIEL